jgi:hypothetical protein
MLRAAFVLCLFHLPLLAVPSASAADGMLPDTMEVGKVGKLWPTGEGLPGAREVVEYLISEVGDDWLALRVAGLGGETRPVILVRGVPTKGLVDDRRWKPEGVWKVVGTEKYKGKTVFTLRPHKDDGKK